LKDTVRRTLGLKNKPYDRRHKIKASVKALRNRAITLDTTTGNKPPAAAKNKVCEDRNIRRQVMHAFGKSGKSGQKKALWTKKSKIKCKE
jgi:hypothetical protein